MSEDDIIKYITTANSKADVSRTCNISKRQVNEIIAKHNLDISHFKPNTSHIRRKFHKIIKTCPVCNIDFDTISGSKEEKTTCSRSCSNTYFRTKSDSNYRKLFTKSELICSRCGYDEYDCSVDIHHIDHNRLNNDKSNLLPLCSNCHQALHCNKWSL